MIKAYVPWSYLPLPLPNLYCLIALYSIFEKECHFWKAFKRSDCWFEGDLIEFQILVKRRGYFARKDGWASFPWLEVQNWMGHVHLPLPLLLPPPSHLHFYIHPPKNSVFWMKKSFNKESVMCTSLPREALTIKADHKFCTSYHAIIDIQRSNFSSTHCRNSANFFISMKSLSNAK